MKKLLILLFLVSAQAFAAGKVNISHPWARETLPGQDVGVVYLDIESGRDAKIVAAESALAGETMIHVMKMEKGMMDMSGMSDLSLPAGKTVSLAPGGTHIMLEGLKKPLVPGMKVPLTLTVEFADKSKEKIEIEAPVRPLRH